MPDDKPKNTTASIFANARRSAKNHTAGAAEAHTQALTCRSCGAPRKDGAEALLCAFCGGHMTRETSES